MARQIIDCKTAEIAMQWALEDILTHQKIPDQETLALIPTGEMSDIIHQLSKNPSDEITTRKVFASLVPDHSWLGGLRSKPVPSRNGQDRASSEVKERTFQLHPLSYFKNKPKREWLCHDIVYDRSTSIFYGDSGSGKSTFVLDMFLSCACRTNFVNRATKPSFLVWIAGESSDDLYPRAKAFLLCNKIPEDRAISNFLGLDRHMPFDSPSEVLDFIVEVKEQLVEIGVSSESHSLVLAFDTYAKCTPNSDENGTQDTKVITASIDAIVKDLGCHVSIIHHANAQSKFRGNTALKASVDTVWFVIKDKDTVKLHCEKMRGTKEPDDIMVESRSILIDDARIGELDATAPVIFARNNYEETENNLLQTQIQILEILKAHGKLTCSQWQKFAEEVHAMKRTVFYSTRKSAEKDKLITSPTEKVNGKSIYYTLTAKGLALLV